MRSVVFVVVLVSVAACSSTRWPCGPENCDGCCAPSNGVCRAVIVPLCVSPGGVCRDECLKPVKPEAIDAGKQVVVAPDAEQDDGGLRLFTTSAQFRGDLTLIAGVADPLAAADSICQRIAEGEGLAGTWMAFLTTDGGHPAQRFRAEGPWRGLKHHFLQFESREAVQFSAPNALVRDDERGDLVWEAGVWTGFGFLPPLTCDGWTRAGDAEGTSGSSERASEWYGAAISPCRTANSLYCFEQARTLPDGGEGRAKPTFASKRAFVTAEEFSGDLGGVEGAHRRCEGAAAAAGLGGSWRAWIGTNAAPAGADFTFAGPWTLVGSDGGVVAPALDTLRFGTLRKRISVDERGVPSMGRAPWTAAHATSDPANCVDWTQTGDAGRVGDNDRDDSLWHDATLADCETPHPLYCFEQ